MLPFRIVYHEGYDLNLGQHVFPSQKFRWIRELLLKDAVAGPEDFIAPAPARDEDILLVHEPGWVNRLKTGTLSYQELVRLEIPYSRQTVDAYWLAAGGSILASRRALEDGVGVNLGGGFHHAFPGHGEGFCAINDIAVAVRRLQADKLIRRAMVVDCDVHHGNGTAVIFSGDPTVFTLSIHQLNNYPAEKPAFEPRHQPCGRRGRRGVPASSGQRLPHRSPIFNPDLVMYVAGADPFCEDQLGGLALSFDGLAERDRLVIWTALNRGIPVAVVLAGGYAENVYDTVRIHCATVQVARDVLDRTGWKPRRTNLTGNRVL